MRPVSLSLSLPFCMLLCSCGAIINWIHSVLCCVDNDSEIPLHCHGCITLATRTSSAHTSTVVVAIETQLVSVAV